jgi:ATP-dependent DNA helicase PIF1
VLVNGSIGKVTEFLTTSEALKRNIAIATLDRKGAREDAELVVPPPRHLIPLHGHVFRKDQFWPLVRFTNGMELLCAPVEFSVEGLVGNVEAHRLQVPLILAWALSIHKSQGQTLSRVKVDLDRIFEKGQGKYHQLTDNLEKSHLYPAYVALSRATTMETLEVINFQPSK